MTKKTKKHREWHASNSKMGMGDFRGRAVHAKMGKIRQVYSPGENPVAPKKLGKPPKKLA